MTPSELAQLILCSEFYEVGTGAGKTIRPWTNNECALAEYVEKLEVENKRLQTKLNRTVETSSVRGGLYLMAETIGG